MGRQIVSFGSEGRTFNFRAAAVIVHGGRVLLHRAEVEDFWSLPGVREEMLEAARNGRYVCGISTGAGASAT